MNRPLRERVFVVLWLLFLVWCWPFLKMAFEYKFMGGDEVLAYQAAGGIFGGYAFLAIVQYLALGYASPDRLFRKRDA